MGRKTWMEEGMAAREQQDQERNDFDPGLVLNAARQRCFSRLRTLADSC